MRVFSGRDIAAPIRNPSRNRERPCAGQPDRESAVLTATEKLSPPPIPGMIRRRPQGTRGASGKAALGEFIRIRILIEEGIERCVFLGGCRIHRELLSRHRRRHAKSAENSALRRCTVRCRQDGRHAQHARTVAEFYNACACCMRLVRNCDRSPPAECKHVEKMRAFLAKHAKPREAKKSHKHGAREYLLWLYKMWPQQLRAGHTTQELKGGPPKICRARGTNAAHANVSSPIIRTGTLRFAKPGE